MGSLWTLLLAPLAARAARYRGVGRTTRTGLTALDWGLALGLGVGMALLCTIWLSPFTVPGSRVLGSPDFGEYCWHTGLYVFDAMHEWGVNRAKLAGLPAGLLAPQIGVMDSLLLSAVGSLAVIVGAVYMWARALHGRTAGVAAAVVLGAIGPLAALGRMVTFYPPVTAGLALASAGAACALRWRTPLTIALASGGAGVALLVDQRGVLWALPAIGLATLATIIGPHKRWRGFSLRLAALVLPLLLAWNLGQWSYSPKSRSLEGQVAIYDELRQRGVPVPSQRPFADSTKAYVFGHSDPRNLPYTLAYIRQQGTYVPSWYHELPEVRSGWQRSGAGWLVPFGGALLLAVFGLRRRPLLLAALAGSCLPFALSMQGAVVMKMSNLRFVASAMVFLPVVLGVGAGVLIDGALKTRGPRRDAPGRLVTLAVLVVVGVCAILGVPPNRLSPDATWRTAYANGESAFKTALTIRDSRKTTKDAGMQMCAFGLTQVEGDGTLVGLLPGGGSEVEPWSLDLP
ncbi:MAG: hypothetical protein CL927_13940 [Deltaproteobacteria bacterium]|nr:hypothetical protein [Deltaproteobacteria bacterium]